MYVCVILCLNVSDSLICNLEPVEPAAFDASRLDGLNASHLTCLMNLTFIGDEKLASNPLFPAPPSPAKVGMEADSRGKSAELDSECLEQQLDEVMAQTLDEDVAADDHNADKKVGLGSAQTDSRDGKAPSNLLSSLSNTSVSVSNVPRDSQDHESESDVETPSHPAPGMYVHKTSS